MGLHYGRCHTFDHMVGGSDGDHVAPAIVHVHQ